MATPANPLMPIAPDVDEQRRQTNLRQQMLQEQARREAESRMSALTQEQAASDAQRRQMGQQHLADLQSQQQQVTQKPTLKQTVMRLAPTAISTALGAGFEGAEGAASALQGGASELDEERTRRQTLADKLQAQVEAERGRQETEQFQGGELARRMEQQTLAERIRDMDLAQRMGVQTDLGYGRQEQQEYSTQMRDKDVQDRIAAGTALETQRQGGRVALRKMPSPRGQEPGNFVPINDASGNVTGWFDPKSGRTVPFSNVSPGVRGNDGSAMPMKPGQLEDRMAKMANYTTGIIDQTEQVINKVANQLGPVAGRWNEFMSGNIGTMNQDYTTIRTWLGMLDSAMTLAHSQGRVSNLIFQQFQDLYGRSSQSPQNLLAALRVGRQAMQMVGQVMNPGAQTTSPAPQAQQQAPWQPPANLGATRVR